MSLVKFSIVDKGQIRIDNSGVATTYLHIKALMSSLSDNLAAIKAGMSSYQRGLGHPTEAGLWVDEFEATQVDHSPWWNVMVTYTSKLTDNPLDDPAEIGEIQTFTLPGATLVDWQGNAILNTAGEPPEPFDKPEKIIQFSISKKIDAATTLPLWLLNFEDCVNDAAFTLPDGSVAAEKTLLVSSVKLSAVQEVNSIKYRTCTTELLLRKATWEIVFPSRGFNQKVTRKVIAALATSGAVAYSNEIKLAPILIKGEVPTEAQFLDVDGKWIENPSPGDVVLLNALLQKPIDFSDLPLN